MLPRMDESPKIDSQMILPDNLNLSHFTDAELAELDFLLREDQRLSQMTADEAVMAEERTRLERSPAAFFREAWKLLEPGKDIEWSWHYDMIGEYLQACYQRQITRLVINVPYRTSKSNQVTICWPAWCWARNQTLRFVSSSYSDELSTDHSIKRRALIESQWYQRLWPVTFTRDTNRQDQYKNSSQGEMIATSVTGTTMGRGGDFLIADDSLNAKEAGSKAAQNRLHRWFPWFKGRLDDPAHGGIVVIEQRTNMNDLTGYLIANEGLKEKGGQWTHVIVPTECELTTTYTYPVTGHVHVREAGDVLQPNRHTPEVIKSRKVHASTWATQDQQRPAPDEGIIFKRAWWKYYQAPPSKFDQIITSWDFAVEGEQRNDFNAGICLARVDADTYVIDLVKERLAFTDQLHLFKNFAAKHHYATRHLLEKKANGPAIINMVHSQISGVLAIEPQGSKEQRAQAASPDCESGNVYLPEGAPWVADFIQSMGDFPNGANDDDVDCFAQGINWLRTHVYSYGLIAYVTRYQLQKKKEEIEYMESAKTMTKPDTGHQTIQCVVESCKSRTVVRIGNSYRCNSCGHTWPAREVGQPDAKLFERNGQNMRK